MTTTTRQLRDQLKAATRSTASVARALTTETDPRIVNAETNFAKVTTMLADAHSLNDVSATDKRREAARLAKATANTLLAIL